MNLTLLITLFGIAVLDSVNPSAIAVTMVQLSTGKNAVARSLAYVLGIYLTYTLIGLTLYLIYQNFSTSFQTVLDEVLGSIPLLINNPPLWAYYFQLALSVTLVLYACFYYRPKLEKIRNQKTEQTKSKNTLWGSFLLGITITSVESVTALPYLGAILAIHLAQVDFIQGILLILFYNFIFILPPLMLIVLYIRFADAFEKVISQMRIFFAKYTHYILKYGFIALGTFLFVDSAVVIFG